MSADIITDIAAEVRQLRQQLAEALPLARRAHDRGEPPAPYEHFTDTYQ